MSKSSLLQLHQEPVRPEWIDHNGHMNVAYYLMAFDHVTDRFLAHIGMDPTYRKQHHASSFTLETHLTFDQEVFENDPLMFTTQLVDFDSKRVHYLHSMYHAEKNYLAATNEVITMHIDQRARKSSAFGKSVLDQLENIWQTHAALDLPTQAGRVIGVKASRRE